MASNLNPYLSFQTEARAAMELYRSVFGGELTTTSFAEAHLSEDPAEAEKLMHAQLVTPNGFTLMASDTPAGVGHTPGGTISISLSGDDADELRGYWAGLSAEGTITLPLELAPWGDWFGMCVDPFGVSWMVNILGTPSTD